MVSQANNNAHARSIATVSRPRCLARTTVRTGLVIASIALLAGCASAPHSDDPQSAAEARATSYYQRAQQAVQNDDLKTANSLFQTAADAGSLRAMYELGIAYFEGRGVSIDYKQAYSWWIKAAQAGDARSQYGVGYLYQQGQGVTEDATRAAEWYDAASIQGHPKAKVALGRLAMSVDDGEVAMKHFKAAAQLGQAEALFLIGRLHEQGMGTDIDQDKAMDYFAQAADDGDAKAQYRLAKAALDGGDQIDAAQKEVALSWLNKAAEQEHAEAQTTLAMMLEQDDRDAAMTWYMRAALNGNEDARERLAALMQRQ